MTLDPRWEARLKQAVQHFWVTRSSQSDKQGTRSGQKDAGSRSAVTGGKQLQGFADLVCDFMEESGLDRPSIYCDRMVEIPGWYRPEKCWDLLVVSNNRLVAALEFKSQVGSFGNNFNNRTEEALGSATDLWAAYREGAFAPSPRPWLGYFMLLEDAPESNRPIGVKQSHFKVFPEFDGASYTKRYEILLTKLVRDRHYDNACLLTSSKADGAHGIYREPSPELSFHLLLTALKARVLTNGE
ncbi:MAG TPA: PaeR7I family type II restriction endonuclease [Edaphobacter sp.]|nr:PaeR7I family type II restriction endonuclease [Edaphobacter sp.]